MRAKHNNHSQQGFMIEPLLMLAAVAIFLACFLPAFWKGRQHGQSILASVGFALLPGTVGLVLVAGALWALARLAIWSDARKRQKELERERRG
jgi:hypothetical protein